MLSKIGVRSVASTLLNPRTTLCKRGECNSPMHLEGEAERETQSCASKARYVLSVDRPGRYGSRNVYLKTR